MSGLASFHLAVCVSNRDDAPASDEWCSPNCPRWLRERVATLETGIRAHREATTMYVETDGILWSLLDARNAEDAQVSE